jgi:copper chaperone CopZ
MSTTYQLSGMHCGACVAKVKKALEPLAGDVEVTLSPQRALLTGTQVSVVDLQSALSAVGKYQISALPELEVRSEPSWFQTYYPLLLIVAFILGASLLVQLGTTHVQGLDLSPVSVSETMRYFMAGFFLVFAFFKLLDVKAFAVAYQRYDLLAARWSPWGSIYPFVELGLGVAYLANFMPMFTSAVTLMVMGFSAIGVIRAVSNKTQIPCACLGTVFKLPMSTVTIVEDVGMVLMAGAMLVFAK